MCESYEIKKKGNRETTNQNLIFLNEVRQGPHKGGWDKKIMWES